MPLAGFTTLTALSKSSSIARGFDGSRLSEVRQVRVDGGGRVQADGFADLPHRRWVAGLRRVLADEVEDLLLPLGQVKVNHRLLRFPPIAGYKCRRTLVRRVSLPADARKEQGLPRGHRTGSAALNP
jgi:hypothetical protein